MAVAASTTTIQSDIRSVLTTIIPTLVPSPRAAAVRLSPFLSRSSFLLRAFSSDSTTEPVVKIPEKPPVCTADELHYVPVPNSDWRLSLWRYHPSPQVFNCFYYLLLVFVDFCMVFGLINKNEFLFLGLVRRLREIIHCCCCLEWVPMPLVMIFLPGYLLFVLFSSKAFSLFFNPFP